MKKFILMMVVLMATISVSAQTEQTEQTVENSQAFRFGAISYQQVLNQMKAYQQIDVDMESLKAKYDAEMRSAEGEFNAKYEVFLAEQRGYAPAILRKRQSELEEMMKRNEAFRMESLRLLNQAREDMMRPINEKINAAIAEVAQANQLAFVLNTDADAVPYLNAEMGQNITDAVIEKVNAE